MKVVLTCKIVTGVPTFERVVQSWPSGGVQCARSEQGGGAVSCKGKFGAKPGEQRSRSP